MTATANKTTWKTSTWRGKDGRVLLALPTSVRGTLQEGDRVWVTLEFA